MVRSKTSLAGAVHVAQMTHAVLLFPGVGWPGSCEAPAVMNWAFAMEPDS